ncbi:NAD kinase [Rhodospirillaceae bacterium AH-315-P19]|nr:NAD kinase [Rhodospirillaceae bacterium AH-315-P19]
MKFRKIAFSASNAPTAQDALAQLQARYDHVHPEEADVIVALGGDGFMLETLHKHMDMGKKIYGMHRGSVGFLMNSYEEEDLLERLNAAKPTTLHPLRMLAKDIHGVNHETLAINEVSLLRETHQTANIRVRVDGVVRIDALICDGILVSTPAGSTAYNLSARGPILPIGAKLLALTPISAFRPRRWRGALLPHSAKVSFEINEADKRPVSAVSDFTEIRDVTEVHVTEDSKRTLILLFDPEHNLNERILKEQFLS